MSAALGPAGGAVIPMSVSYITRQEPKRPGGLDGAGGPRRSGSWPSPPDPGDLSKRVARRRTELHLSKAQVAARAGMSLPYLEYVERYPARPDGVALRRLAAALRTTPAVLLGAGAQMPPGYAALAVTLMVVGWAARRALHRRRLAARDAEWLTTEPRWSPRR